MALGYVRSRRESTEKMPPLAVLIGVDGSDTALEAARSWSRWQGNPGALRIALVSAAPPPPHFWAEPGIDPRRIEEVSLSLGVRQLEAARELFAETQLAWASNVRVGPAAAVIVEEAVKSGADLVVLGTRGLSPLRGLLIGSVALRVAQTSPVPVWLRPRRALPIKALGEALTVLCPVDGSANAERAARWIGQAAPHFGDVTVELLSVQPPFSLAEGLLDSLPQRLDHWSQRIGAAAINSARAALPAAGLRLREVVRTGDAIEEIDRRAGEIEADVIVLGTRGLGALGQTLLGSVSGGLLQTGTRAMIVVP